MRLLKNKKIKRVLRIVFSLILITGIIGFTESKQGKRLIKSDPRITIYPKYEHQFILKEDILDIVTHNGATPLKGEFVENIDLGAMEAAIKKDKFVESVQVYRDLEGNLIIKVKQIKPISRVFQRDTSFYVASNGECLPTSKRFSARVLLLTGEVKSNYFTGKKEAEKKKLMELLNQIGQDKFLNAQVAQLHIDKEGEIDMHMQVSKQVIHIGKPEDIEERLKKVKVFYHKLIKAKGYNHYTKVNVEYKNQIICE